LSDESVENAVFGRRLTAGALPKPLAISHPAFAVTSQGDFFSCLVMDNGQWLLANLNDAQVPTRTI